MKGLVGKPIRAVIDRVGYPVRELNITGSKVYVWEGNGCTLRVAVDSSESVVRADYDGDHSDCKHYRRVLEGQHNSTGLFGG